jgi:hypothetical protein
MKETCNLRSHSREKLKSLLLIGLVSAEEKRSMPESGFFMGGDAARLLGYFHLFAVHLIHP